MHFSFAPPQIEPHDEPEAGSDSDQALDLGEFCSHSNANPTICQFYLTSSISELTPAPEMSSFDKCGAVYTPNTQAKDLEWPVY